MNAILTLPLVKLVDLWNVLQWDVRFGNDGIPERAEVREVVKAELEKRGVRPQDGKRLKKAN